MAGSIDEGGLGGLDQPAPNVQLAARFTFSIQPRLMTHAAQRTLPRTSDIRTTFSGRATRSRYTAERSRPFSDSGKAWHHTPSVPGSKRNARAAVSHSYRSLTPRRFH